MSSIADDPRAELRALRERAYGPGADIHDDPVALQRLRELEDGARDSGTAVAPDPGSRRVRGGESAAPAGLIPALTPSPAVDAAPAGGGSAAPPEVGPREPGAASAEPAATPDQDHDAAADAKNESAASTPGWRRRMPLVWAGSLVAAGVLGAAMALSLQAIGGGQVAVLSADPDAEWPSGFFERAPDGATAFQQFHGLVPMHLPQQMHPDTKPSDCLYLAAPEADSFGFFSVGCGAGPFAAAVVVLVTPDAPDELLERYAPGTALRFVLDGSLVRVYAAAPAPGATP